nr:hypothetical protein CFP56_14811 [Quercus suber]
MKSQLIKDKLIGELPGAYAKAFDLTDQLEEDMEAEEEFVDNSDLVGLGRVAIKLSSETKKHIRGAWSKAIIIKLVGRIVGFSFLQSKLLQLWRPTGRMDCVNLTCGFFLDTEPPPTAEEGQQEQQGQPEGMHEMHDNSRTTASKVTHSVSEAEHEEGQYGPWMVVHQKKKKRHKGPRQGQTNEGLGASTWNSSSHFIPKSTDGINVFVGGPSLRQNESRGGFLHKAGVQARFEGLGQDQGFGFGEKLLSSPHKEASLLGKLRHLDYSKAHRSNSRPSTLLSKIIPHSVEGKKAFARKLSHSPVNTSSASPKLKGALTHLSFTSPKLAHSAPNEINQAADTTFEFTALPNAEMFDPKHVVATSNGRASAGGGKEGNMPSHMRDELQPTLICSDSGDGGYGIKCDTVYREGTCIQYSEEDRMESEDGSGAISAV